MLAVKLTINNSKIKVLKSAKRFYLKCHFQHKM